MTAEIASPLPQTCCPSVWLWPGQALYSGPSLNLAPHSGSVWCLGSQRSGHGGLIARTGGRRGVVRVAVSSPVPRRTRNQPASLSALGSARTRRHGRRRRKELDYRGGRGRLRQPVAPRRPVQDDVRTIRYPTARDGADPADAVAARPNTIDSSAAAKRWPSASRTKL
jgi:hypothetical protein